MFNNDDDDIGVSEESKENISADDTSLENKKSSSQSQSDNDDVVSEESSKEDNIVGNEESNTNDIDNEEKSEEELQDSSDDESQDSSSLEFSASTSDAMSGNMAVDVNYENSGIKLHLQGQIENFSAGGVTGTLEAFDGALVFNLSLTKEGDNYIINGQGNFIKPPLEGEVTASVITDSSFVPDFSTLETQGQATISKEVAGSLINMTGTIENGKISSLSGTIEGPEGSFIINVSVVDNGESYTISGEGEFVAGPVQGSLGAQIETDSSFNIDPSSLNINGIIIVDKNVAGIQLNMTGAIENSRFASLEGNVIGPNNMFNLTASVVDNGDTYTISGSGDFTAGPAAGTLTGEITTDSNLNPDINTLNVGGEVNVDTNLAGNQITMSGTMADNSLQSLVGTIEGPNGMYLLEASVVDNGEGYTITGTGDFHVGPIEGSVTGQINTDTNFTPDFDSLSISGEADVDTETAGHHITMNGVMENGRLVSLEGTVVGPEDLYTITASITDNGDGYTIIGDGTIDKGIIQGSVHGEIDTDSNFTPDFDTLNFSGEVTIQTESAGQKIAGSAVVKNGFLESISATMEGPGGLYTLYAQGKREEQGYDLEGGAGFTFFDAKLKFSPPPILIPTPVPGLNVEISADMGFNAKAMAEVIAGIKTDHHFVPDLSTFEIRAATIRAQAELFISIFGGLNVNLGFASASAGVKAKLSAIIDAWLTLTGDSKGIKMQGNMYGALMGALYAAIKLRFLFFSKEFDFLIVEGKVASVEKDFGPEDFTIGNLIKAFAFGMDDLSLPGKDRKGKPPDLKARAKSDEISDQVDKSRDEDDKKKEEEENNENESNENSDNNRYTSDNSSSEIPSTDPRNVKKKNTFNDGPIEDDGKGGGRDRGRFGNGDDEKSKSSNDVAQMKINNLSQLKQKKKDSIDDLETTQLKSNKLNSDSDIPVQRSKSNNLPDNLQNGVESLSGQNMSDVNVHYNSPEPEKLNAHAFAQGNDIHLSSGQEKHLPHEAWHVAQQKQGRVSPTKQLKSKVLVNDDSNLEKEADIMGQKSLQIGNQNQKENNDLQDNADISKNVKQLYAYDKLMNNKKVSENSVLNQNNENNVDNNTNDIDLVQTITNEK